MDSVKKNNSIDTITLHSDSVCDNGLSMCADDDLIVINATGAMDTVHCTQWPLFSQPYATGSPGSPVVNEIDWPNTDLNVSGDFKIAGMSLKSWMNTVNERLALLTPHPELEKEWSELAELRTRYEKLVQECQEKMSMWENLNTISGPPENV